MRITSKSNKTSLTQVSSPSTEPTAKTAEKRLASTAPSTSGGDVKPVLLLEVGRLQVFGYQTVADWTNRLVPEQVFWKHANDPAVYGPFASIYQAGRHHVEFLAKDIALQKLEVPANIIVIDFKTKKRLN